MTGQEENMDWKQTLIPEKRRAMFWIVNSVRGEICFVLSRTVPKKKTPM